MRIVGEEMGSRGECESSHRHRRCRDSTIRHRFEMLEGRFATSLAPILPAMDIEVAVDACATIGESPLWVAEENALYWIDIRAPALYRFDIGDRSQRAWTVTSDLGAFALLPNRGGALLALREGIFELDFQSAVLTRRAAPPYDPQLYRFNEGACDATGRFWVGVMFDPLISGAEPKPATLHSFTLEDGLRPEPDVAELHNGMAWSPDGRTFYLSHSRQREIYAFSFDERCGALTERHSFAKIPSGLGVPDGAAVDSEGGYWCALHGAGRLHRYTASGKLDVAITLPVSQPTMCTFGGEALDTLYITSARDKLSAQQLKEQPIAGALLYCRPRRVGVPRRCTVR